MVTNKNYGRILWCIAGLPLLLFVVPANATIVDLSTTGASGNTGGALFWQWDGQATGTGLIDAFVEIQGNSSTLGAYNTTVNGVLDNGSSDQHNHELLLGDIPTVNFGGIDYREFILDINQSGSDPLLSLDELQLFLSDTPNQGVTDPSALANSSLIYDLDGSEESYVLLNYGLNGGSGSGDMLLYIPDSYFGGGGADPSAFVYLYSLFGQNADENAGGEEWAVRGPATVVPEPASMSLALFGVACIAIRRARGAMRAE